MLHLLCIGGFATTSVAGGATLSYNQLAGADAASARFHVRCRSAAPLSSRPLYAARRRNTQFMSSVRILRLLLPLCSALRSRSPETNALDYADAHDGSGFALRLLFNPTRRSGRAHCLQPAGPFEGGRASRRAWAGQEPHL